MRTSVHKAGAVILRNDTILLCKRKRVERPLILPGGKIERGETEVDCLVREVREELNDARISFLRKLGTFVDRTSPREGVSRKIRIELFLVELAGPPSPSAEIAELIWFGRRHDPDLLSPSLRNQVIPYLLGAGLLSWQPLPPLWDGGGRDPV